MIPLGLVVVAALAADEPFIRSFSSTPNAQGQFACLHWSAGTLTLRQNDQGNSAIVDDSEFTAITRAMVPWQTEFDRCGNLSIREGPHTSSRVVGYRLGASDNQNILMFRMVNCTAEVDPDDPCWTSNSCGNAHDCWDHSEGTIALTTTSYDPSTGRLFDADVEANAGTYLFTTVDAPQCAPDAISESCVAYDVENTFTHELGHVVGLAHTTNPGSVMNPSAPLGETSKRVVDQGTLDFVCPAYPKGHPTSDCLPAPEALTGSSLSCDAVPRRALGAAVLAAWWWLRRRRRGRPRYRDAPSGTSDFE